MGLCCGVIELPNVEQPNRARTPPGVGTPLCALGLPVRRHPFSDA